jgi:hypothetical protein
LKPKNSEVQSSTAPSYVVSSTKSEKAVKFLHPVAERRGIPLQLDRHVVSSHYKETTHMTTKKTRALRAMFTGALLTLACATPVLAQSTYGGSDGAARPAASVVLELGSFSSPATKLPDVKLRTLTLVMSVQPLSFVDWYIESDPIFLGKFQADAAGKVEATVTLPASIPAGDHTLVAKGTGKDGKPAELRQPVTLAIEEAPAADTSSLSFTGSDARGIAAVGGVLLVVGGAATFATRRRLSDAD